MILPIRLYGDPALRRPARPVEDFEPIPELAEAMLETMYDANGQGLAAPQVGRSLRLFVMLDPPPDPVAEPDDAEGRPPPGRRRERIVVNPVLETLDSTEELDLEGCLSIPDVWEEVPRPRGVRLRYRTETGEPREVEAGGMFARVIQHENDHLDGRLFLDLLPREVTLAHRRDLAEMQRRAQAFLKREREKVGRR